MALRRVVKARRTWVIILVVACLMAADAVWVWSQSEKIARQAREHFLVVGIQGAAQRVRLRETYPTPLARGMWLAPGDFLAVADGATVDFDGQAGLRLRIVGPASIQVDTVLAKFQEQGRLRHYLGEVYVAATQPFQGQSFEIETPNATVSMDGTRVLVETDGRRSTVSVSEGIVSVLNLDGDGALVDAGQTVSLSSTAVGSAKQMPRNIGRQLDTVAALRKSAQVDPAFHLGRVFKRQFQFGDSAKRRIRYGSRGMAPSGAALDPTDWLQVYVDFGYIYRDIQVYHAEHGRVPESYKETMRTVDLDPWGRAYLFEAGTGGTFRIASAGPDKTAGSSDDLIAPFNSLGE